MNNKWCGCSSRHSSEDFKRLVKSTWRQAEGGDGRRQEHLRHILCVFMLVGDQDWMVIKSLVLFCLHLVGKPSLASMTLLTKVASQTFFLSFFFWKAIERPFRKDNNALLLTHIHKSCTHSRLEASHAFPDHLIVASAARRWHPGVWLQSPAIWLQSPVVPRQRWRQCWCHGTLWISGATTAVSGSVLPTLTVVCTWLH